MIYQLKISTSPVIDIPALAFCAFVLAVFSAIAGVAPKRTVYAVLAPTLVLYKIICFQTVETPFFRQIEALIFTN